MIKVIGKYGIEASDKCYAAGKIGKTIDKKTGEETEYIQNPAYCTNVQSALKAIRKRMQNDAIKNMDCDLETAINKMRQLDERFNKLVENIDFKQGITLTLECRTSIMKRYEMRYRNE